jgi:Conserved hypothetical protein (Lin0512_fam)
LNPVLQKGVDVEQIKKAFPYGNVTVKVVPGGLRSHAGIVFPKSGRSLFLSSVAKMEATFPMWPN